jgi:hypothetical protein
VTFPLVEVFEAAEREARFGNEAGEFIPGIGYDYQWIRDPFSFFIEPTGFAIETVVRYRGEIVTAFGRPARCGESEDLESGLIELRVRMRSLLAWSPQNWGVESKTSVDFVEPITTCDLTLGNLDATPRIVDAVRRALERIAGQIDSQMTARSNLKPLVTRFWTDLHSPIDLGQGTAWLIVNPSQIYVTPLRFGNQLAPCYFGQTGARSDLLRAAGVVSTSLGFVAAATVLVGPRPPDHAIPAPPGILPVTTASQCLHVEVEGSKLLKDIESELREALTKPYQTGDHRFKISDAKLDAQGKRILFEIDLSGDLEGKIYVTGQISYDDLKQMITIQELDYVLDSGYGLPRIIDRLGHTTILEILRSEARFTVAPIRTAIWRGLNGLLNRKLGDVAALSGFISDLALRGIVVVSDAPGGPKFAKAVAAADGDAVFQTIALPTPPDPEFRSARVIYHIDPDDLDDGEKLQLIIYREGAEIARSDFVGPEVGHAWDSWTVQSVDIAVNTPFRLSDCRRLQAKLIKSSDSTAVNLWFEVEGTTADGVTQILLFDPREKRLGDAWPTEYWSRFTC